MKKYTVKDVGCFGDSSFGHQHVRNCLATLLQHLLRPCGAEVDGKDVVEQCIQALQGEMSDDASEEYEAIEMLNDVAVDGVHFEFCDGDLLLRSDSELDE